MRLRCIVGFHEWRYGAMSAEFILRYPNGPTVYRTCLCCAALQYAESNGVEWRPHEADALHRLHRVGPQHGRRHSDIEHGLQGELDGLDR